MEKNWKVSSVVETVGQRIAWKHNKHLKSEKVSLCDISNDITGERDKINVQLMEDSLKGHISVFAPVHNFDTNRARTEIEQYYFAELFSQLNFRTKFFPFAVHTGRTVNVNASCAAFHRSNKMEETESKSTAQQSQQKKNVKVHKRFSI